MKAKQDGNSHLLNEKVAALSNHLGLESSEFFIQINDNYGMTTIEADGCEYAIATDVEADAAARESIEQSVWAFNASFILSQCNLPSELEDGVKAWQEKECEDCNDAILKMINRLAGDSFFDAAISCDGRGHFITSCDGEENECDGFFIYRLN